VGDSGYFSFYSTTAVCTADPGPDLGDLGPSDVDRNCSISVNNDTCTNDIFGTGVAGGTAAVSSTSERGTAWFIILFNATVGIVEGI